jgi:hypothetical protein
MGFGEVHGPIGIIELATKRAFHSGRAAEGNAGAAASLILYGGDEVTTTHIAEIEGCWGPYGTLYRLTAIDGGSQFPSLKGWIPRGRSCTES